MYQLDNNFSLSLLTCCRYIVYLKSSFSIKNNLYLWQPISRKKVTWFCKRNSNCIFVFFLSASRECDQFELFFESPLYKFSFKTSPNICWSLGAFENCRDLCKNCSVYFLGNFWERLGYFLYQHPVTVLFGLTKLVCPDQNKKIKNSTTSKGQLI